MKLAAFAATLTLLAACGEPEHEPRPDGYAAPDQRAVIEAVLGHVGVLDGSEQPLFLEDLESVDWVSSNMDEWLGAAELRPGLVSSFLSINAVSTRHEEWLGSLGVGMVDAAAFQAHFSGEADDDHESGWQSVLRGPPECTVVVSLSAPGFSTDGSQALITVGESWGVLSGSGGLYLLERQGGAWVVVMGLMSWDS